MRRRVFLESRRGEGVYNMYNDFVVNDSMKNGKKYDGNTLKFGITVNNKN